MSTIPTPIIGLIIAVFVLVFLVIRTRVHALIAMLAAACIAGITGGMSIDKTLSVITQGFGSTLGSIGIVIGLGVMMGRLLEVSGAAEQIAYSFIKWLGKRREEWALAITGYIVSIPIFVDSAFVILYPVAKALAKSGKRSLLTLGVALAGGLVVTHHTVPPTPGPLGVAGLFDVDIGAMLLMGMALAIPCVIGIVFYAQWLDRKYPEFSQQAEKTPDELQVTYEQYLKEKEGKPLPSLTLSLLPILGAHRAYLPQGHLHHARHPGGNEWSDGEPVGSGRQLHWHTDNRTRYQCAAGGLYLGAAHGQARHR